MKSKRERRIEENINYFNTIKAGLLEEARLYKQKHPDWDKMPDISKIDKIYAIFPIMRDAKSLAEESFCRLTVDTIDNYSIKCKYKYKQTPGLFHGEITYEGTAEIKTAEFNNTWFISKEVAFEELTRRIEKGDKIDPILIDLVPMGMARAAMIGRVR